MRLRRFRWLVAALALIVLGGGLSFLLLRSQAPDARWNGAYRLDDGRLVVLTAREGDVLRYRMMDGESRVLWPTGDRTYESGPGWARRAPVELPVEIETDAEGRPTGFLWDHPEHGSQRARRLDLPERIVSFPSGDLTLRGKLVLPSGEGPHPAVVPVHGSGRESAVDTYYQPYLFASHGVATFVYDKRGTGGSAGEYTQNFHALAGDTLAAVEWLRQRPEVDPSRIHLAGYSQGGWIAPLAASRTEGIRSLLIAYGPMVPVTQEDRWGYVYALRKNGFGEAAIAEADRINDVVSAIVDHGENRWAEARALLDRAQGEPWFEAVRGSDSLVGFLAGTRMPWWLVRLYGWWHLRPREVPFIDRLYDPVPTLASLDVPSLWIFGGEDHSMPTGWSVEALERLQAAGRPIEVAIFPDADHGILSFEETDSGRRILGYEEGFLPLQVAWLRERSGLDRDNPSSLRVEPVEFANGDIGLAGDLIKPAGSRGEPLPAILFIHGSGESDRTHYWSRRFAESMAGAGFAFLLPDKRGSGASGGDWRTASFEELADDALAGVRYLRAREDIDPERIGVAGFSQGGRIVSIVAAREPQLRFVINVSGSAVSFARQVEHEMANRFVRAGLSDSQQEEAMALHHSAADYLSGAIDWDDYKARLDRALESSWAEVARGFPQSRDEWRWEFFRGVMDFTPLPYWRRVTQPTLIVYGAADEDENVPVAESVRNLEEAFEDHPDFTIRVFEGTGHGLWKEGRHPPKHRDDFLRLVVEWARDRAAGGREPIPEQDLDSAGPGKQVTW